MPELLGFHRSMCAFLRFKEWEYVSARFAMSVRFGRFAMSFGSMFFESAFASVFVSGPFASSRLVCMLRVLAGASLLVSGGACLSACAETKRWLGQMEKKCARFTLAAAAVGGLLSGVPMYAAATGIISTANPGANQVTLELTSSAAGTGYFTLLADAKCGTAAQTVAGQDSAGAAAFRIGSLPLTAKVAGIYTVKNLTASTAYTICFTPDGVAMPVRANVTTAAATAFSAAAWTGVGSAGFSAGVADFTSLAFSPSGTPYVAYSDHADSGRVTVMEYNGTSWVLVGSADFSAGEADFTSLAFSPSGTPYVAYSDGGQIGKATVMEYNGTSWVLVGSAGFSASEALYMSLAFSPSGTPYVAYQDDGNGDKATVMEYNGTLWVTAGSAGFSAGLCGVRDIVGNADRVGGLHRRDRTHG
jgi:hypothetical protein